MALDKETIAALIGAFAGSVSAGVITYIITSLDTKRKHKKEIAEKIFQNHKEFMDNFAKLRSLIWQIHSDHRLYAINALQIELSNGQLGNNPLDTKLTEEMTIAILKGCNEGKISFQNKYTLTVDALRNKINFFLHYFPDDNLVRQAKIDFDKCINQINSDLISIKNYYDNSKNHLDNGKYINDHLEKYKAPLNIISGQMLTKV
jgi:hypothetical protein